MGNYFWGRRAVKRGRGFFLGRRDSFLEDHKGETSS